MEKTETMLKYEQETGISAIDPDELECYGREFVKVHTQEYVAWLEAELQIATIRASALQNAFDRCEAKATAYDRLMSGGKKTLKEWANLTGRVVVITCKGLCLLSLVVPHIGYCDGIDTWDYNYEDDPVELPRELVNFSGDWKDSLTLPDGWED